MGLYYITARLRCVRSAAYDCSDGDACTVDTCAVVETRAQADCLHDCNIFAVQGWLYSPAIDNDALIAGFGGGG